MSEVKTAIWTPKFRLSFPHLYVKQAPEGSEPKYSATMLFHKSEWEKKGMTDEQKSAAKAKHFAPIIAAVKAAATEAFGSDPKKWPKRNGESIMQYIFKSGDAKTDLNGYAGATVLTAKSDKKKPEVWDRIKDPETGTYKRLLDQADGEARLYAGCYARAQINVYPYSKVGQGLALGLIAIQFVDDGEAFGGGSGTSFADAPELPEQTGLGEESEVPSEEELADF